MKLLQKVMEEREDADGEEVDQQSGAMTPKSTGVQDTPGTPNDENGTEDAGPGMPSDEDGTEDAG